MQNLEVWLKVLDFEDVLFTNKLDLLWLNNDNMHMFEEKRRKEISENYGLKDCRLF